MGGVFLVARAGSYPAPSALAQKDRCQMGRKWHRKALESLKTDSEMAGPARTGGPPPRLTARGESRVRSPSPASDEVWTREAREHHRANANHALRIVDRWAIAKAQSLSLS